MMLPPGASWITQLNDLSACQLADKAAAGTSGRFPCDGRRKLSVGMWPLSPSPQGGVPSAATVATLFGGPYWVDTYFPAQLCVWDMFGETQINSTGADPRARDPRLPAEPGVHRTLGEYWWALFGAFLKIPVNNVTCNPQVHAPSPAPDGRAC
jgi:hypothetical protein